MEGSSPPDSAGQGIQQQPYLHPRIPDTGKIRVGTKYKHRPTPEAPHIHNVDSARPQLFFADHLLPVTTPSPAVFRCRCYGFCGHVEPQRHHTVQSITATTHRDSPIQTASGTLPTCTEPYPFGNHARIMASPHEHRVFSHFECPTIKHLPPSIGE